MSRRKSLTVAESFSPVGPLPLLWYVRKYVPPVTVRLVHQLSLPGPQSVIPSPPVAQLGPVGALPPSLITPPASVAAPPLPVTPPTPMAPPLPTAPPVLTTPPVPKVPPLPLPPMLDPPEPALVSLPVEHAGRMARTPTRAQSRKRSFMLDLR